MLKRNLTNGPQDCDFFQFFITLTVQTEKHYSPIFQANIILLIYRKVKGVQLSRAGSAKKSYPGKKQKVPNRSISHQCICFLHYMQILWYQTSCRTMSTIHLKVLLIRGRLTLLCIQRILESMRKRNMSHILLRHILASN